VIVCFDVGVGGVKQLRQEWLKQNL